MFMNLNEKDKILDRITNIFVNDFESITTSKNKINDYLHLLNITELYDYNSFCVDLLKVTEELLNITQESNINIDVFIIDILGEMVKGKIINSNISNEQKEKGLMQLELDKHLTNYNKNIIK